MNFTKGERFAFVALLCVISLGIGVIISGEQVGPQHTYTGQGDHEDPWWVVPEWWNVLVNVPIAAATLFLWFLTRDTLKQTKRSVDLNFEVERGRLVYMEGGVDFINKKAWFKLKNIGNTPITIVEVCSGFEKTSYYCLYEMTFAAGVGAAYVPMGALEECSSTERGLQRLDYTYDFDISPVADPTDGEDGVLCTYRILYETVNGDEYVMIHTAVYFPNEADEPYIFNGCWEGPADKEPLEPQELHALYKDRLDRETRRLEERDTNRTRRTDPKK